MKTKLNASLLALLLCAAGSVRAGPTDISQLPLLDIKGTGAVKPNLMILYDNSGSMKSTFMPDYVDDSDTCRARAYMLEDPTKDYHPSTNRKRVVGCTPGHAPFNSAQFNSQYYNPALRYKPPVKADGSSYPEQTATATTNWTKVATDAFNVNNYRHASQAAFYSQINLTSEFEDLEFGNASGSDYRKNTATYTYPNNTFYQTRRAYGNPYYYNIQTAEYCSDVKLTNCTTVGIGAAAPADYPFPAKVRWCNNPGLLSSGGTKACQGKYNSSFKYPRFSNPDGGIIAAFGTITIGSTGSATSATIDNVTVSEAGTPVVITSGVVTAPSGTNTATKQATLATLLASSIIAKTGLANQYAACVKTPTGTTSPAVPACDASYGIAANNIVVVIPLDCEATGSDKATTCSVLADDTRSGWPISVTAPLAVATPAVNATAILELSGTTQNSGSGPTMTTLKYKGVEILSGNVSPGKNKSAATAAAAIQAKISGAAAVAVYAAGNAITPTCAAASGAKLCFVEKTSSGNGGTLTAGTMTGITFTPSAAAGYVAGTTTSVPTTTAAFSAGSALFQRVDIVLSRNSYPKSAERKDCTGSSCTYAEEMTNFANWYTYYKTRNQMMKTSVGLAFKPITNRYRVGLAKLSEAAQYKAMELYPAPFETQHRIDWYAKLYAMNGSDSTPLRPALDAIGNMYANQGTVYGALTGEERVVQYACQQNFAIMTTDGYWNGGPAPAVTSNDESESKARFCTIKDGCVDERSQSTAQSLADVALYWYNGGSATETVSLRPDLEPDMTLTGTVPAAIGENTHLHMSTYTLGLGVDGVMTYEKNYDKPAAGGDFANLINRVSSGCPWNNNGAYVWPDPNVGLNSGSAALPERVDDLWHAAINGHGKYFSASAPDEVVAGFAEALNNMEVRTGAAAAAATSTPNISQQDNDIFADTFTTVRWWGELSNKKIDIVTGNVPDKPDWTTSETLGLRVQAATDTRKIYMAGVGGSGALRNFLYGEMSVTEKGWFDNKCDSLMTQCPVLNDAEKAKVNSGTNLVNWLRGQQQHADDKIFRAYAQTTAQTHSVAGVPIVLGDIVSSKPAYLREPRKSFDFDAYQDYVVKWKARKPTVFTAANDGMLHAFNAGETVEGSPDKINGGEERWAYVPRITMKKLATQASTGYAINHQFTADGSPEVADVLFSSDNKWHTILVAGLNGGGRGYYALDVSDPEAAPKPLWELCADSAICSKNDGDIGLTFGNAQFGTWVDFNDGDKKKWVVFLTSGYNNTPGTDGVNTGDGKGYLYVVEVETGTVLLKVPTGSGDKDDPSGFAKITSISSNPFTDPLTTFIYGGDVKGKMWRFDMSKKSVAEIPSLMGDAGVLQPITTRPDVTQCKVVLEEEGGKLTEKTTLAVAYGTGRLLHLNDVANTDMQSVYVLRDSASRVEAADWLKAGVMEKQTLVKTSAAGASGVYTISGEEPDLSQQSGWFVNFDLNSGERVNLDPKIVGGTLVVVTNIPSPSSTCSVGGSANVYQFNVCTGDYVLKDGITGVALSNDAAAVGFIIIRLPSGALKLVTTTAKGKNLTSGINAVNSLGTRKVGWRRVRD